MEWAFTHLACGWSIKLECWKKVWVPYKHWWLFSAWNFERWVKLTQCLLLFLYVIISQIFPNIFVSVVFWIYYLTEYPSKKIYDFKPILIMCYPKIALGSEWCWKKVRSEENHSLFTLLITSLSFCGWFSDVTAWGQNHSEKAVLL